MFLKVLLLQYDISFYDISIKLLETYFVHPKSMKLLIYLYTAVLEIEPRSCTY